MAQVGLEFRGQRIPGTDGGRGRGVVIRGTAGVVADQRDVLGLRDGSHGVGVLRE